MPMRAKDVVAEKMMVEKERKQEKEEKKNMKMGGKGTARVARSCIKFFSDLHSEGRRELCTEEAQETSCLLPSSIAEHGYACSNCCTAVS